MSVLAVEVTFTWITVFFYAVAFVLYSAALFWPQWGRRAGWPFLLGFAIHTVVLGWRWYEVAHGPYVTSFEAFSSTAWVIAAAFLLLKKFSEEANRWGIGPSSLSVFFLLVALKTYDGAPGVPTAYHYFWLAVHVIFTKLSVASLSVALGAALYTIFVGDNERAQNLLFNFTGLTLCFWTFSVAAGAVWANIRWGRYWGWDPIESWSLLVWLTLGLSLHLQKTMNWKGKKAAYLTVFSVLLLLFVLVLIPFVSPTVHTMYLLGGEQ